MKQKGNENNEWIKLNLTDSNIADLMEQLKAANADETVPDLWKVLEDRKKKGLWSGEIEYLVPKSFSLIKGKHYFVIEDNRKRSLKCISCKEISHGTILESHMLSRYRLADGILYLDNEPLNEPADVVVDKALKNL